MHVLDKYSSFCNAKTMTKDCSRIHSQINYWPLPSVSVKGGCQAARTDKSRYFTPPRPLIAAITVIRGFDV